MKHMMFVLAVALVLSACTKSSGTANTGATAKDQPHRFSAEFVPSDELQKLRISPVPQLEPSDDEKILIAESKHGEINNVIRLCVAENGSVTEAAVQSGSGYVNYDMRWLAAVKSFQYEPFVINGPFSRVCTDLRVVYRQSSGK